MFTIKLVVVVARMYRNKAITREVLGVEIRGRSLVEVLPVVKVQIRLR
jgi:hypothetical protein